MKYTIKPTARFSKDLKSVQKRGYKLELLTEVIKATPHKDHLLDFARILLASFPSDSPKTP